LPVDFFLDVERDMRVELCEQGFGVHGGQHSDRENPTS
jgi:hypothetical protein